MISRLHGLSQRSLLGLLLLGPILLILCLLLFAPPDGTERLQLLQFVGRFHPLSVHLPIALLMVVPLLELAGRTRHFPYLLPAADFLLFLAAGGAAASALLGWSLARNGGYEGPLVTQHMWGGALVLVGAWLCWMLRGSVAQASNNRLYAAVLIATVGIVSFTGYRGGQLSQGENHLTEFMPSPLASLLGVDTADKIPTNSANGAPGTFYGAKIQPILAEHCFSCHARSKHKANLRLDHFENLMHGGKHGLVIKAGDPKGSELFRRITLAPSDEAFMPPENKRPLSAADIKLIEQWITAGASGTLGFDAIKAGSSNLATAAPVEVAIAEVDPATVVKQRAQMAPILSQLQQRFPNILDYESRDSADIVLSASWMGAKFSDSELAALAPLREQITAADLSNTAISDKSGPVIGSMSHLQTLRLMHTKVGDSTMQALGSLHDLETLSIFDTLITPASLPVLAELPKLRHVYANNTKIARASKIPAELRGKLVF